MNAFINTASEYVARLLAQYTQGRVHSVYRKTINLSFDGQLVALQATGSPLSPISLITSLTEAEMSSLSIEVGDAVCVASDSLKVGKVSAFFLGQVCLQDLELKEALAQEQLVLLKDELCSVLLSHSVGSFEQLFSNPDKEQPPFLVVAKKHMDAAAWALSISHWEDAAKELCCLLGLGLGLTPGGDDFLCGVLAGLILCGEARHPFAQALAQRIDAHLSDTNAISGAFLQCALKGQFSQAVNSLRFLPSREEILVAFSAIGHSSGMDTLCGIMYLLQHQQIGDL